MGQKCASISDCHNTCTNGHSVCSKGTCNCCIDHGPLCPDEQEGIDFHHKVMTKTNLFNYFLKIYCYAFTFVIQGNRASYGQN